MIIYSTQTHKRKQTQTKCLSSQVHCFYLCSTAMVPVIHHLVKLCTCAKISTEKKLKVVSSRSSACKPSNATGRLPNALSTSSLFLRQLIIHSFSCSIRDCSRWYRLDSLHCLLGVFLFRVPLKDTAASTACIAYARNIRFRTD